MEESSIIRNKYKNIWAVIASGPSLNANDVNLIRELKTNGVIKGVVAVSNVGIDMFPDADALVSHDAKWWEINHIAKNFKGRKFSRMTVGGTERFLPQKRNGCNSGLMAMEVANDVYNADLIIILGFDMHGTHYFGRHPESLKNTPDKKFAMHIAQFNNWNKCDVINCTKGSALKRFPIIELTEVIKDLR
jgi:hypothetical protein